MRFRIRGVDGETESEAWRFRPKTQKEPPAFADGPCWRDYSIQLVEGAAEVPNEEEIASRLNFKRWYFGHYHRDRSADGGYRFIYNDICEMESGEIA